MARALSETRTKMIGMVMADTGNPYYSSVYSACCDEAYQRGYIPMLLSTQSCPEMEVSALTKLAEQRADAIIVCGGRVDLIEPDTAFTRLLMSIRETTHIVLGSRSHYERIYGISVDHEASMNWQWIIWRNWDIGILAFFIPVRNTMVQKRKWNAFIRKWRFMGCRCGKSG